MRGITELYQCNVGGISDWHAFPEIEIVLEVEEPRSSNKTSTLKMNITTRQKIRKRLVAEACEKLDLNYYKPNRMYIDDQRKIIYCFPPKVRMEYFKRLNCNFRRLKYIRTNFISVFCTMNNNRAIVRPVYIIYYIMLDALGSNIEYTGTKSFIWRGVSRVRYRFFESSKFYIGR